SHHEQDRNSADNELLLHGPAYGLECLVDERRAVVERDDPDPLIFEPGLKRSDLLFDPLCDLEWILAVAHQHHATDGLTAVLLEHASAEAGTFLHGAELLDIDRRAIALGDDGVLEVAQVLDPADRPDQELGIPLVDDASSHGGVGACHGGVDFAQAQSV